jgi:hypothetical protein
MILGIDLGTSMGWVLGDPVGPLEWGTFECAAGTHLGKRVASADAFWRKMLPRCDGVAVEKPNTAGNSAYFAIRSNMALLGALHYWSTFYPNVRVIEEISVMSGKLALSGNGHASKEEMIAAAAALGYEGMTEHEADALGIWWIYQFGPAETKAQRMKRIRAEMKGKVVQP